MMLSFLLARMGVDVLVLEKHADFLRDFRGDTIHPSTLEVMHELGILDEFLKRPHQEVRELAGQVGGETVTIADFTHLPTHCRFIAFMPQWDFLNFIVEQARRYPAFHLRMQAEVTDLIEENGKVAGVRAKTPEGILEARANLTVGADGRHSVVRERAGLPVINLGAPMDVMWMRLSRRPGDPGQTFGHVDIGRILVLLNREDYWQCAFVIPKGAIEEIRQRGLASFREEIAKLAQALQSADPNARREAAHRLEEMKNNARREAELILREAELSGEKAVEAARGEEGKIRADIMTLKRTRRQLVEEVMATLDRYHRILAADLPPGEADASAP